MKEEEGESAEGERTRSRRRTDGVPRLSRKLSNDDGHDVVSEVEVGNAREEITHALERETAER